MLVSELSGKGTVQARADVDGETATRVIERVKELENRGYQFEAAEGSFELNLKPGRYTVRLRAYGFNSQNRSVIVNENGVTVLNAELRKK